MGTPRKPPRAELTARPLPTRTRIEADPAAVEAFVAGVSAEKPPEPSPPAPAPLPAGRRVVRRQDGRELVRSTLQLPPALDRRMKIFAASQGLEQGAVIIEALEAHLTARGA